MKKTMAMLLACLLLSGCAPKPVPEKPLVRTEYVSRFAEPTRITLTDGELTVEGDQEAVHTSRDIVYYEDREAYDSGNPYGEGEEHEKHTREEAEAHTVVNITKPGAYVVMGRLPAGQIRVDLGEDACEDPDAVVELILQDADITCTVAPAILFLNTYECDGGWSKEDAKPDVDTSAAGANLILEGKNIVSGSHVAKIFKDQDGEKKLWKQDGAIYSYMSMNVFGPGSLELTADNEGMDTQLHLTVNGGDISIFSDNDGINTNEDGVSVTTVNGGTLRIAAGLGAEGDGIDSNGYLVINGGTVISAAKPASDAGLDSDLGSFIHGGTVVAMGAAMDWAESNSRQVTMNLQFAGHQQPGSAIRITKTDGTEVFSFTPEDPDRGFSGLILSAPALVQGERYQVWINDVQQQYTGTDVGPGGFGGGPGGMKPPAGFPEEPSGDFGRDRMPEGEAVPRGGFGREQLPEGMENRIPPEGFGDRKTADAPASAGAGTEFYLADKVNAFSGVTAVTV